MIGPEFTEEGDMAVWAKRALQSAVALVFIATSGPTVAQQTLAPASARSESCELSSADQAWVDRALAARRLMARQIGTASFSSPATVILFDQQCIATAKNALSDKPVIWGTKRHDGQIMLPDGRSQPAGVTSFAGEHAGEAFFVMSTPSLWRANRVPEGPMGLENLMIGVFLHESAHVAQFSTYMRRVGEIAERNKLPDSFGDDSIQERFRGDQAFATSVAQETDLLYQAAAARDDDTARQLVRKARDLIVARRARWFTGPDAYLAETEDLFLALEGSGQWVGYGWLTRTDGGRMTPADAIAAFGRRGGWWTQDEGLALILATERIGDASWRARAFGDGSVAGVAMLDQALGAPER